MPEAQHALLSRRGEIRARARLARPAGRARHRAGAGHRAAPWRAGDAGAHSRRPRCRSRRGGELSRSGGEAADARSRHADRRCRRRRHALPMPSSAARVLRSSAITMSMARPRRHCWRAICAIAGCRRSSIFRTGCSKAMGRMSMRCARLQRSRCDPVGHGRLRHDIDRAAGRSEQARHGCRGHRSSSMRCGIAARACDGESEPARRSFRPEPSRRRRACVHDTGRGQSRIAPARLFRRRRGASPICWPRSIWSRSAPSRMSCR